MQKTIEDIYNFFKGNPVFNVISLVLAIAGIIFTSYFYFKSKRNKAPIYLIRTISLVRQSIKKIETVDILFSGRKIENLSLAKIALWNDGKDTINNNDVAKNQPIKIVINDEFEILDAEIIFQKNAANDFKINLEKDKKSLLITFDYFDFEEGIVVQIAHTGNSSDDIEVTGQIKSVKKIYRREALSSIFPSAVIKILRKNDNKLKRRTVSRLMGYSTVFMGLFAGLLPFLLTKSTDTPKEPAGFTKVFMSVIGLMYVWFGYNILKRRIPKGFDIFNEEF